MEQQPRTQGSFTSSTAAGCLVLPVQRDKVPLIFSLGHTRRCPLQRDCRGSYLVTHVAPGMAAGLAARKGLMQVYGCSSALTHPADKTLAGTTALAASRQAAGPPTCDPAAGPPSPGPLAGHGPSRHSDWPAMISLSGTSGLFPPQLRPRAPPLARPSRAGASLPRSQTASARPLSARAAPTARLLGPASMPSSERPAGHYSPVRRVLLWFWAGLGLGTDSLTGRGSCLELPSPQAERSKIEGRGFRRDGETLTDPQL